MRPYLDVEVYGDFLDDLRALAALPVTDEGVEVERSPYDFEPHECEACQGEGYILAAMGYPEEHPIRCEVCHGEGEVY